MKTAEEWNIIYSGICFNDKAVSGQLLPNPQNVKFIKSVQDDIRNEIKQLVDEMIGIRRMSLESYITSKAVKKVNAEIMKLIRDCEVEALTEIKNKLGL